MTEVRDNIEVMEGSEPHCLEGLERMGGLWMSLLYFGSTCMELFGHSACIMRQKWSYT